MNYSTYNISLDIHETASQVSLNVKKGDTARRICAVLTENGKPYKIAEGVTAEFSAKKPADSNGNRAIVCNYTQIIDNKVCYVLTSENTEIAGIADCEFTLRGTKGEVLTCPKFTLVIDNTVNTDGEVAEAGKNELTDLSKQVLEAQKATYNANKIKNEVETKLANGEFVGEQGEQGATYTPNVSADGVISWTNDRGLDNPHPVNIKGVQGKKGDKGDQGIQGVQGIQGERGIQGEKGEKGDKGQDGYTPIKGVDYYTATDKEEFRKALSTELLQSANAIKGTAHGQAIRVDDVSPVEHTVKANVSPSTAKVIVRGKNLVNNSGTYSFTRFWYLPIYDAVSGCVGKSIAVSYEVKLDSLVADTNQMSNYAYQGQGVSISSVHEFVPTTEWQRVSFVTTVVDLGIANTSYSRGAIAFYDKKGENVYSIRNIQIELGSEATEYESYEGATYTPNADGVVEITSVSPIMTLLTDSATATIECEYNRDTNKVIAELLSLCGGVSRISSVSLPSAKWQGTASPYSQVVSIDGVTEYSKIDLNPSVEQLDIFHKKDIAFVTENEDGIVTVYCIGEKPANDYTMQVTITEVKV